MGVVEIPATRVFVLVTILSYLFGNLPDIGA